jgi:hypothetical protein
MWPASSRTTTRHGRCEAEAAFLQAIAGDDEMSIRTRLERLERTPRFTDADGWQHAEVWTGSADGADRFTSPAAPDLVLTEAEATARPGKKIMVSYGDGSPANRLTTRHQTVTLEFDRPGEADEPDDDTRYENRLSFTAFAHAYAAVMEANTGPEPSEAETLQPAPDVSTIVETPKPPAIPDPPPEPSAAAETVTPQPYDGMSAWLQRRHEHRRLRGW